MIKKEELGSRELGEELGVRCNEKIRLGVLKDMRERGGGEGRVTKKRN